MGFHWINLLNYLDLTSQFSPIFFKKKKSNPSKAILKNTIPHTLVQLTIKILYLEIHIIIIIIPRTIPWL